MKTFYTIIALLLAYVCFPQHYSYRHYTVFDGLPQNQCGEVYLDRQGFIWVATKAGVARFDGETFNSFGSAKVFLGYFQGFFEIKNFLFAFTHQSVYYFNGYHWVKVFDVAGSKESLYRLYYRNNGIFLISSDAIYTLTPYLHVNKQLFKDMIPEKIVDYYQSTNNEEYASFRSGTWLLNNDADGKIRQRKICNSHLHFFFTHNSWHYSIALKDQTIDHDISGVVKVKGGDYIVLYESENINGLELLDNNCIFIVKDVDKWVMTDTSGNILDEDSLDGTPIISATFDTNKNLWIATENGLFMRQSSAFVNYTEKSGMPKYIWSVVEDSTHSMLFFSYDGRMSKLSNGIISTENFKCKYPFDVENFLMNALCSSSGQVLISTGYNILVKRNGFIKLVNPAPADGPFYAMSITEDPITGNVFFGTTKGLYICDRNINLIRHIDLDGANVLSLDFDKYGRLMASTKNGVYLIQDNSISGWKKNEIRINNSTISLKKDFNGNIWYASKGELHFYFYTGDIVVSDNQYFFISQYKKKYIIAGGIEGVLLIDLQKFYNKQHGFSRFFDRYNGFSGIECGQNGTCVDSKGNVWIPASESVVKFMPERLTFDSTPPPVFLYLFETSSSDLHFDTAAVFPEHANTVYEFRYNQNNVRIGFHALAYSCPERVTYKYRLIGSSEIWNMTSETTITYTNLGPGDYKFEVIAANENGIWSKEPVVLSFRIVPAFWQTLWFKASMIVLITALITFVIYQILRRKRVREQKERDAERRLINLQMSTINAQLDPHFIFNTITAIGSSVQDRMTDEAYSYFVKMSQLLRTSLKESHSVTRTLDEEIHFVGNYMSLQKYRFADRVSYTLQVDDSVNRKTVVPKMCIQIFAENAVKHGLENKPEGGSVAITINQNEKGLLIIIKDDGVGRTAAAKYSVRSTGVGLRAFREFFSIMNRYNTESAWYRITDLHDGSGIASGTLVEVFIPIGYHYLNN